MRCNSVWNHRYTIIGKLEVLHDGRNILIVIQAYSLFYCFNGMQRFHSNLINEIAKTSLAIYLITENFLIRGSNTDGSILWHQIWNMTEHIENGDFIIYSALTIIVTFVLAVIIDYIRIKMSQLIKLRLKALDTLDMYVYDAFYK